MSGSTFGRLLKITTWGESHGPATGVVLDGFPAGLTLSPEDIQPWLSRRRPGRSAASTSRQESDLVEILSGVFEGRTTGTPISMLVRSTSQHSSDYEDIAHVFRPGHADYTYWKKYGLRDWRGGGRSSGRETIGRVAAGAVCGKLLKEMGVDLLAYTASIGPVRVDPARFDRAAVFDTATAMPDRIANQEAMRYLADCRTREDSCGSLVECLIRGVPAGVGSPVFDKLDARLAGALMSIGAVKAVEIGDGCAVSQKKGSENNDEFMRRDTETPSDRPFSGDVRKRTNHAGGILGGISDGSDILIRCHFKPTPSIARTQSSVTEEGKACDIRIHGRHDPVIAPRAAVVVEAMCAVTLLDEMLCGMSARAEDVVRFYTAR